MSSPQVDRPPRPDLTFETPHIPDKLRARDRWVLWNAEWLEARRKWNKPPYRAWGDGRASTTDPTSWADLDTAVAWARARQIGIGTVFDGDGISGIDFDHVVVDGKLIPEAAELVRLLNSYTELSPSGTGVHVIVEGQLPAGVGGLGKTPMKTPGATIEIYSTTRYLTVTGRPLPDTPPTVEERQDELDQIVTTYFAPRTAAAPPPPPLPPDLDVNDEELLELMFRAKNGAEVRALWDGNLARHDNDESRADAALCSHLAFWCRRDPDRIDRLFRQSRLLRSKWDERRGAKTYGERTIDYIVAKTSTVYEPDPLRGFDIDGLPAGTATKQKHEDPRVAPLLEVYENWCRRVDSEPAPRMLIHEQVPDEGTVVDFGRQRSYKSWSQLLRALAHTTGRPYLDDDRFENLAGSVPVAYFTEEDPPRYVRERLRLLENGHGYKVPPDMFHLCVRKGLSLDDPEVREAILDDIRVREVRVAVFEPIRSFTALAETTGTDFAPIARWFRRIQNETATKVISLGAHTGKPPLVPKDERVKSERLLGGALRTLCDAFFHYEKLDARRALVEPLDFKFGQTPEAYEITLDTDAAVGFEDQATFVRFKCRTVSADTAGDEAVDDRVLAYLRQRAQAASGDPFKRFETQQAIQDGARIDRLKVGPSCRRLSEKGLIVKPGEDVYRHLGKPANAKLWGLA